MLKNKLTPAEHEALDEGDRKHYSESSDGKGVKAYFLQTDENATLKRSLATERDGREKAEKALKLLVPDLDVKVDGWAEKVETEAEHLKDIREAAVDVDEWKAIVAAKGKDPKDPKAKEDASEQLLESQRRVRELEREKQGIERERAKFQVKSEKLTTENDGLHRTQQINKALDAAGITDPEDRQIVEALWQRTGITIAEVGAEKVGLVKVEGQELPLIEYAKDFAATDMGKRFVKAPDNSGGGDGPKAPTPVPLKDFQAMNPSAMLATAIGQGVAGAGK